jgi:antitoxin MazE
MLAKVQKWGNSLALRLPKALADEIDVQCDSPVRISVQGQAIVIEPVREQKVYSLEQLLDGVREENLHQEADFGRAEGQESW